MDTSTPVIDRFTSTDMTDAHATQLALAVQEILKQRRHMRHVTPILRRGMPGDASEGFVLQLASVFVRLSKRIGKLNDHKKSEIVKEITSNNNMWLCLGQTDEICKILLSFGPQTKAYTDEDLRFAEEWNAHGRRMNAINDAASQMTWSLDKLEVIKLKLDTIMNPLEQYLSYVQDLRYPGMFIIAGHTPCFPHAFLISVHVTDGYYITDGTNSSTATSPSSSHPHALVYDSLYRGMFIANLCFLQLYHQLCNV
jgi:hypothetical protein